MIRLCLLPLLLLAGVVTAQKKPQIVLTGLPSVARVGERIDAQIRIESDAAVTPPVFDEVEGLQIQIGNGSLMRSQSIVNGVSSSSVSTAFRILILPRQKGKLSFPALRFAVGGTSYTTKPRAIEIVANVTGRNFGRVVVKPSRRKVYVHEPLRIEFECELDAKLELVSDRAGNGQRYLHVQWEVDWLAEGQLDGGQVMEVPETVSDQLVNLVLNRRLQSADVATTTREGKTLRLFKFQKSILPTRSGKRRLSAPLLRFTALAGTRQTVFGPQRSSKEFVLPSEPIEIEVLPLPKAGRPAPFYGAVGRFAISAAFDKSVVDVGGSIKLLLTITGEGNMEHLRVPELDDLAGLHRLGKIEKRQKDQVVVTYDMAPQTAELTKVDGLNWNYFDTSTGKYVAVQTDPLPLTVRAIAGEKSLVDLPGERKNAVEAGVDDIFDVKLVTGPSLALTPPPSSGSALLFALLPWLVCVLGMFFWRARRRSLADVDGRRAKGAARKFQQAVSDGDAPLDAFVAYLADRLGCESAAVIGTDLTDRLQARAVGQDLATRIQSVVDAGVAARYGGGGGVDAQAVSALVDEMERTGSSGAMGLALVLLVAALFGTPANAQADPGADYRKGDYSAAEQGFRAAAERGDRRAYYNLGNALFRQGKYARALAAYESARLAMPRDVELLANIALVEQRLDLGSVEGEAFAQSLMALRDSLTPHERLWLCVLLNALAAAFVCFGERRLRIVGFVVAVPALVILVEVGFLSANRAPAGVVVEPKVDLRAEPRADLEALKSLRAGVRVEVLTAGTTAKWLQVRVDGRRGYVPSSAVDVVQ